MKTALTIDGFHVKVATRTRRRWLVALVYLVMAALVASSSAGASGAARSYLFVALLLLVSQFFGTRTTPGALLGIVGVGDEREGQRWNLAHTRAYETMRWLIIAGLLAACLLSPNPVVQLFGNASKALVDNTATALVIGGIVLYATLPHAILLWTEPDMEQPQ